MPDREYKITEYRPEFKEGVLKTLRPLWGSDTELNQKYFKWKYERNPYADRPAGIVAIHRGRIVGFRGYFPQRLRIPSFENGVPLLLPGDSCVDAKHRRKGISVDMGRMAMKVYAQTNAFFLNTSCSRSSFPGYKKLDFLPLTSRAFLMRYTSFGLLKYFLYPGSKRLALFMNGPANRSGDIFVVEKPRVDDMCALAATAKEERGKVALVRDAAFYRWRFCNPKNKYIYYYTMNNDRVSGFVVLSIFPYNSRVYVLDYAAEEPKSLHRILLAISKHGRSRILMVNRFSLDKATLQIFRGLGFKQNRLLQTSDKLRFGEYSLLIRPVKEDFTEHDFIVGAIDLREISNWSLKPICSDYA